MLLLDSDGDPAYVVTHWVISEDGDVPGAPPGVDGVYALPVSAAQKVADHDQLITTEARPVWLSWVELGQYTTETYRVGTSE
jgi:hypothetical protein